MAQILGQRGCLNADLEIVQEQAIAFEITHVDEEGKVIDHTGEQVWCRLQRKDYEDVVLDSFAEAGETVTVAIPGSETAKIHIGTWVWDLFVEDVRLVYGLAKVYDSYAKDGE